MGGVEKDHQVVEAHGRRDDTPFLWIRVQSVSQNPCWLRTVMAGMGFFVQEGWISGLYSYRKPRENIAAIDHLRFDAMRKVLMTNSGRQTVAMSKDMLSAPIESWNTG